MAACEDLTAEFAKTKATAKQANAILMLSFLLLEGIRHNTCKKCVWFMKTLFPLIKKIAHYVGLKQTERGGG